MVGQRRAVFRFVMDISNFIRNGKVVTRTLNEVDNKATRSSASMDRMASSTRRSGDAAAAASVNFQTMTQGMLNLTTAGVQTFTSFSNLDRAGNRLAQSQIAVARAEDLLNNKQLRLNQLRAKGLADTQKAVALENELATARADLKVKTDKLKIEEGALFDIQLLFATNIANVMISSLQTIKTLKDLQIGSTIKLIIQEKILGALYTTNTVKVTGYTGAMANLNRTMQVTSISAKSLMFSLGPIAAIIAGGTIAVQAYMENWGGFRDFVQDLLPFLKDKKALLKEVHGELEAGRKDINDYNDSLNTTADTLGFKMPNSLGAAISQLQAYRIEIGEATKAQNKFNGAVSRTVIPNVSGGVVIPEMGGGIRVIGHRPSTPSREGGLLGFLKSLGNPFPTAEASKFEGLAQSFPVGINDLPDRVQQLEAAVTFLERFVYDERFRRHSFIQQSTQKGLKFFTPQSFLQEQVDRFGDPANPQFQRELRAQEAGLTLKELLEREAVGLFGKGGIKKVQAFGIKSDVLKGRIINGIPIGNQLRGRLRLAEQRRTQPRELEDFDLFNLLLRGGDVGSSTIIPTKLIKALESGGNRAIVARELGVDIGEIAESVTVDQALILGQKQKILDDFGNTTGGKINDLKSAIGGNATKFFQVPRGSIKVPHEIMAEISKRDRFLNSANVVLANALMDLQGSTAVRHTLSRSGSRDLFRGRTGRNRSRVLPRFADATRLAQIAASLGFAEDEQFSLMLSERLKEGRGGRGLILNISREFLKSREQILENIGIDTRFGIRGIKLRPATRFLPAGPELDIFDSIGLARSDIQSGNFPLEFNTQFFQNAILLAQLNSTNFNNTGIIEQSINKLDLTNRQVFDVRFDPRRGDRELEDRIRFHDRLLIISTGENHI